MRNKLFYRDLIITLVILVPLLFVTHKTLDIWDHASLSYVATPFFILLSFLAYFLAVRALASDNKNSFIRAVMINVMVKMFSSVAIIIFYAEYFKPETKLFVVPFFIIYIAFTIFETYFLTKLAKAK